MAFGKFELVREIGRGGAGIVYEADDGGRRVALKILVKPERVHRLDHPHIIRIHEVGEIEAKSYVSMELVDGPTLDRASLDRRQAVVVMESVARAVQFAHQQGILHRDLKPENILLRSNGEPVLTDFGLAKTQGDALTKIGTVIGTPAYMAPEQIRGRSDLVDARTDIYALGVVLYRLLAGRVPFEGESILELQQRIINDEPPLAPVEPDLQTIILRAMQKERDHRFASAGDFADDLRNWLDGKPIRAKRPSLTTRIQRTFARHRGAVATLAIVLVLGGVLGAAIALQPPVESVDRESVQHATREREALEDQIRLAKLQEQAIEVYRNSEKELHLLRMRSYRSDWKLTSQEFSEYDRLIQRCSDQMKISGNSADGWWVIGRARHILGDFESADEAYEKALAINSDHSWALLYKARLMLENSLITSRLTYSDNEERHQALEEASDALALLSRAVKTGVSEIELDLAKGYEMAVRKKQAKSYCDEMLVKWKGADFHEEFYLIRTFSADDPKDFAEALKIRPGFYEGYYWRAIRRQAKGDGNGAFRDLTKALDLNPRLAIAYNQRGALRASHEPVAAFNDFCKAIEVNPRCTVAYINRGLSHMTNGNFKAAVEDQTRAIEIQPSNISAYTNRGIALSRSGNVQAAMEDCLTAIRIEPRHSSAYNNLGFLYLDQDRTQEALDVLNHAILTDDKNVNGYMNRGSTYGRMAEKHPARATEYLQQGIRDLETALRWGGPHWRNRAATQRALKNMRDALGEH